jgi:hypothetical protein
LPTGARYGCHRQHVTAAAARASPEYGEVDSISRTPRVPDVRTAGAEPLTMIRGAVYPPRPMVVRPSSSASSTTQATGATRFIVLRPKSIGIDVLNRESERK